MTYPCMTSLQLFTDGSLPSTYNLTFTFKSCISSVFCSSLLDEGGCVIRYGQDPSHQDLGPPHTGPPQLLLPPTPHGGYYNLLLRGHHQLLPHHSVERELDHWRMWARVWLMLSRSYYLCSISYVVVDVRLTTTNQVLLGVGIILWSVASIVGIIIILIIVKVKTRKGEVVPL